MKSGLRLAVLGCLVGSALVLLALSMTWLSYDVGGPSPLPSRRVSLDGAELVGGGRALGLLALAAVAALLATRSWGRRVVGAILSASGVGIAIVVVGALADPTGAAPPPGEVPANAGLGGWPYAALLGALFLIGSGALVLLRGRRWQTMGTRYRPPAAERPLAEGDTWAALDRGEDPTAEGK